MPVDKELATLLASHQNRLYAYALSLVGEARWAEELLQQANLVICDKADDFVRGSDFMAWAGAIVHYTVLADRKKRSRDRLVFSDETLAALKQTIDARTRQVDRVSLALHECLKHLTDRQRSILRHRYDLDQTVLAIAEALNMTGNAVDQALLRIRRALAGCIRRKLDEDAV
ncbi:MAG: sigma-70 family RNA polymerase sigma factor [Planctomycetes bacterium]|nr:sigma-70 family RNA polymerase sigma factor [Planctomycetota bacterium]